MLRIKSLLMAIVAFALFAVVPFAVAQDNETANGMQISPTRTDMSLLPGEKKDFTISIKNVADVPLRMKSTVNDFESDGVTGSPQIIVDENRQVSSSLREYITGLGEFDIAAGESKDIKLTVDMPSDSAPGAYYGAVRFTIIPKDDVGGTDTTQVSLNASVASLLFVEVSGDIKKQIQIESMDVCSIEVKDNNVDPATSPQGTGIQQNCEGGNSIFLNKEPTVASIKIANKGNGFSQPFGRVTVTRGSNEVYAYELNNSEPRGTILPASTRVFSNKIEGVNKFGRYTLTASLSHGDGGEVIVQTTSFWYIPIWVLILAGGVLIALLGGGFFGYKKLGKKRK